MESGSEDEHVDEGLRPPLQGQRRRSYNVLSPRSPRADSPNISLCSVSALPYPVYLELVAKLNAPSANHNDWKTLAARLGLHTGEILSYDEEGMRASSVLRYMSDQETPISELIGHLRSMERHDTLRVLAENGITSNISPAPSRKSSRDEMWRSSMLGTARSRSIDELSSPATRRAILRIHEQKSMMDQEEVPQEINMASLEVSAKEILLSSIKRRAIVFGIGEYALPELKLASPKEDVSALARALDMYGWDVEVHLDCTYLEMRSRLDVFSRSCKNSIVFLYFSGLGVQIEGKNFLLPMDIPTTSSPATISHHAISLQFVMSRLGPALMKILLIDACRPVPRWPASVGLSLFPPPPRCCCIFPCQPGHTTPPMLSTITRVSPFLAAFLNQLTQVDIPLHSVMDGVCQAMQVGQSPGQKPCVVSSGRGILPLAINSTTSHGLRSVLPPRKSVEVHTLIITNSSTPTTKSAQQESTYLGQILKSRDWQVEAHSNLSGTEITSTLCTYLMKRSLDTCDHAVTMVIFSGFVARDEKQMYMLGADMKSSEVADLEGLSQEVMSPVVSVDWLVRFLSETVIGPKVVVFDALWECPLLTGAMPSTSSPPTQTPPAGLSAVSMPTTETKQSRLCHDLAQAIRTQPSATLYGAFKSLQNCFVESCLFYM